jgi:hypothetical protein
MNRAIAMRGAPGGGPRVRGGELVRGALVAGIAGGAAGVALELLSLMLLGKAGAGVVYVAGVVVLLVVVPAVMLLLPELTRWALARQAFALGPVLAAGVALVALPPLVFFWLQSAAAPESGLRGLVGEALLALHFGITFGLPIAAIYWWWLGRRDFARRAGPALAAGVLAVTLAWHLLFWSLLFGAFLA